MPIEVPRDRDGSFEPVIAPVPHSLGSTEAEAGSRGGAEAQPGAVLAGPSRAGEEPTATSGSATSDG